MLWWDLIPRINIIIYPFYSNFLPFLPGILVAHWTFGVKYKRRKFVYNIHFCQLPSWIKILPYEVLEGITNGEKNENQVIRSKHILGIQTINAKPIDVPNYHELSVKHIYLKLKIDKDFCKYMLDF